MITAEQFLEWLYDDTAMRCLLLEAGVRVGTEEITRRMSNRGYVTGPNDTPPNTEYPSLIAGGIRLTENLKMDGTGSLSWGDIEFYNNEGDKDSWLNDVWTNRPLSVYLGDVRWPREDFQLVFTGVSDGLTSRSRNRLNLKLRDVLQRLNTPASEVKLGGTSPNKDRILPILLGECHNIEPLMTDEANHEYMVHLGPIEGIIEVRDNGLPVSFSAVAGTGKFRLNQQPMGQITVSAQGDKTPSYSNSISHLIQRLVTSYGKVSERFTAADIDTANWSAFGAANTQPVGLYASDRINVLQTCQQLAASIGAQLIASRTGKLKLMRVDFPPAGTPLVITPDMMVDQNIKLVEMPDVEAAVKLGYCKNWTVQSNLDTGVPEAHLDLYKQEWLTVTGVAADTATVYKLNEDPQQVDTLLLVESDAINETNRRLNIKKVQRKVFQFDAFPELLTVELGKSVTIFNERYDLQNGKLGVITSLSPDWMSSRITVQVTV